MLGVSCQREWQQRLQTAQKNLIRAIERKLADTAKLLTHLNQRLKDPRAQLRERAQRIDELEQRLLMAQKNMLRRHRGTLALLENRVLAQSPLPALEQLQRDNLRRRKQLESAMQQRLHNYSNRLSHMAKMLDSLSPLGTLQRGYAIVTDSSGSVLLKAGSVSIGDDIEAKLASGRLGLTVKSID